MTTVFDARLFIKDFVGSMNTKDPTTLLRHYSDNVVLHDPSLPEPVRGKDAITKSFEQWSASFGELDFNIKEQVTAGSKVALLIDAKARHTGPLDVGPGERIAPTGRTVRMEVAEFLTIGADGKISRDETIFDVAGMLAQLKGP